MSSVMTIYGTRPEAIKVAPLIAKLHHHADIEAIAVVTGQHREMLDQVNSLFGIQPAHDFNLMSHGATLDQIGCRALEATSNLLRAERPDAVVVQGDTATAFFAGLAAFYQQIPVVHLEAGLRTGNVLNPFPEEANRRLLAPITSLHLAPTSTSLKNLLQEGVPEQSICVTGNTVIDALHSVVQCPASFGDPALRRVIDSQSRLVVVTTHRRESWGPPMEQTALAVRDLATLNPSTTFVLPMHRNAIVRETVEPHLGDVSNVVLTEPLSYHEFAHLMAAADLILTDSGGVQEEAPSLGKPVLVLRETTERPEAVEAGTVRLVGTDRDAIVKNAHMLLTDELAYAEMANAVNPYGDGAASDRAAAAIAHLLGHGTRLPDFVPASRASDSPG